MSQTTYEPDALLLAHGTHTCQHCGCLAEAHHSDGRCYTAQELVNRWSFYKRTKRWPEPDEGCTAAEGGPAP